MPGIEKLTTAQVARLTKPGKYGDSGGLYLQIGQGGAKIWIFRLGGGCKRAMSLWLTTVFTALLHIEQCFHHHDESHEILIAC